MSSLVAQQYFDADAVHGSESGQYDDVNCYHGELHHHMFHDKAGIISPVSVVQCNKQNFILSEKIEYVSF